MKKVRDLSGLRFGSWTVLSRAEVEARKPYWHCLCDCGEASIVRGSHLTAGTVHRCRHCRNRASARARTLPDDQVTYKVVHLRLAKQRGSASAHACVACGDPAEQWAYQHGDSQEMSGEWLNIRGERMLVKFTPNLDAYAPMCRTCHWRMDVNRAKETTR